MLSRDALHSARQAHSSARRMLRFWPVLLLLLPVLGGCIRAVQAMPAHVETPLPTPTLQAERVSGSGEPTAPAAQKPVSSTVSLEALRFLFLGGALDSARDSEQTGSRRIAALVSPLATPPSTAGLSVLLPTPTPTPPGSQAISLSETASFSPTIPITALLDVALPEASGAPEPGSNLETVAVTLLPTPTPQPASASALPEPTPDGAVRSVRVPILMYHYVSVPPSGADIYRQDLSVAPDLFAVHLDAMQNAGYTAITLYELVAHLTQGSPLPEKPVVITFDDGYRDNFDNALPLLRERGMAATFFVVTDFMDEARPEYLTWDMARDMLAAGMKIESHGRNHVSLRGKDSDYLVWQALGSLETIAYELGTRPRFVSYPAGEYDQATADIFASAGYWAGATTVQGATHSSDALFDLHRVRVRGSTSPEELLRLLALDW